jgi:hypothetical protein
MPGLLMQDRARNPIVRDANLSHAHTASKCGNLAIDLPPARPGIKRGPYVQIRLRVGFSSRSAC